MKRVVELNKEQGTAIIEFNEDRYFLEAKNTGIDHSFKGRTSIEIELDLFVNNAVWVEGLVFYNSKKQPLFTAKQMPFE